MKISNKLKSLVEEYKSEEFSSLDLMIDRGLYLTAINELFGAGALEHIEDSEISSELKKLEKKLTFKYTEKEDKLLFYNVEIWINEDTNQHYFIDTNDLDESIVEGLIFDSGYDQKGKLYKKTVIE